MANKLVKYWVIASPVTLNISNENYTCFQYWNKYDQSFKTINGGTHYDSEDEALEELTLLINEDNLYLCADKFKIESYYYTTYEF